MEVMLLPETVTCEDGTGGKVTLDSTQGNPLMVILEITRVTEQQSLDVSIWGSSDSTHWRKLATFPQKYYCRTYLLLLDLTQHREVRYVRAVENEPMGKWRALHAERLSPIR